MGVTFIFLGFDHSNPWFGFRNRETLDRTSRILHQERDLEQERILLEERMDQDQGYSDIDQRASTQEDYKLKEHTNSNYFLKNLDLSKNWRKKTFNDCIVLLRDLTPVSLEPWDPGLGRRIRTIIGPGVTVKDLSLSYTEELLLDPYLGEPTEP